VIAEETFGADLYSPVRLGIVGESLPGRPASIAVQPGQAIRIMTGAPLPDGANGVVPFESTQEEGEFVLIRESITPGKNVGRIGEDIREGQNLLQSGRCLRPQDIGVLSSLGISVVQVVRKPKVEILVTGDEILPSGSQPQGCRIVDSNSPMLKGLVERDGGEVNSIRYLTDQPNLIREAMATSTAEILFISGGSSVGREDHAPRLLAELGTLHVHGLALRPASPAGFGSIGERIVFLLPGNPVSCLCAYDLLARIVVQRMGGIAEHWPYPTVRLPLGSKVVSALGRLDYVRAEVIAGEIHPIAISGASMLSSTVRGDGFLLVDSDREGHAPGEIVELFRYDGANRVTNVG
jgi:molybdopterin molybdotransferase